jgi:hypothetical protein
VDDIAVEPFDDRNFHLRHGRTLALYDNPESRTAGTMPQ